MSRETTRLDEAPELDRLIASIARSASKRPEFPERLRLAVAGYDHQEIVDWIGKSRRALTGWLAGSNEPLASTVADLCEALDVSADWLLGLSDKRERAA